MSVTKLMSGTPGTINSVQAMSGWKGVSECMKSGTWLATVGLVDRNVVSQPSRVAKNALMAMPTYPFQWSLLKNIFRRKPRMAANDA